MIGTVGTSARAALRWPPRRLAAGPALAWWAVVGLTLGLAATRVWYRLEVRAESPLIVGVTIGGFVIVIVSGLAAWAGRPDSRVGVLLVAWGLIGMTGGIYDHENGFLLLWSHLNTPLVGVVFAHALLTYPGGRTAIRVERAFLMGIYASVSLWILNALVSEPWWISNCTPASCPPNPVLIRPVVSASWVLWWSERAALVGLGVWFVVLMVLRLRRITPAERHTVMPVAVAAAVPVGAFLLPPILDAAMLGPGWWWWVPWWLNRIGMLTVPVAIAVGLRPSRPARASSRLAEQVQAQLAEVSRSRSRLVTAADEERRRLERDLHDGAQQSLLGVGMSLQMARREVPPDGPAARLLDEATMQLQDSLSELRALARGLKPAMLAERGLEAALAELVRRMPIPVDLDVQTTPRPTEEEELTAYYVVAEALQNVAKHAGATGATVVVRGDGERLRLVVTDDGRGGADTRAGTDLRGLADRVAAMNGNLQVESPTGGGTRVLVDLPYVVDHPSTRGGA